MPNGVVEALSGAEIIEDVINHIRRTLLTDCNLRDSDAYAGGYDGVIDIKLNLHDMDVAKIELKTTIGEPTEDPNIVPINEKVEIPLEPNLDTVRERIEQEGPSIPSELPEVPITPSAVTKRRSYLRKAVANLERPSMGGAVDIDE